MIILRGERNLEDPIQSNDKFSYLMMKVSKTRNEKYGKQDCESFFAEIKDIFGGTYLAVKVDMYLLSVS